MIKHIMTKQDLEKISQMSYEDLDKFLDVPNNLQAIITTVKHLHTEPIWQDDLWCQSLRSDEETPLKYKLDAITNYSSQSEEKIPLQENLLSWMNYGHSNETVIRYVKSILPEDNYVVVEKEKNTYRMKITTKKSDMVSERELKLNVRKKFNQIVLI